MSAAPALGRQEVGMRRRRVRAEVRVRRRRSRTYAKRRGVRGRQTLLRETPHCVGDRGAAGDYFLLTNFISSLLGKVDRMYFFYYYFYY